MKRLLLSMLLALCLVVPCVGTVSAQETLDDLFARAEFVGPVKFNLSVTDENEFLDKTGFQVRKLVQRPYPSVGQICMAGLNEFPTIGIKFKHESTEDGFRAGVYCSNTRGIGIGSKANNTKAPVTNQVRAIWRCHLTLIDSPEDIQDCSETITEDCETRTESDNVVFLVTGSFKRDSIPNGDDDLKFTLSGSTLVGGIQGEEEENSMFKATISATLLPVTH